MKWIDIKTEKPPRDEYFIVRCYDPAGDCEWFPPNQYFEDRIYDISGENWEDVTIFVTHWLIPEFKEGE